MIRDTIARLRDSPEWRLEVVDGGRHRTPSFSDYRRDLQSHLYQTYSATPTWNPKARGGLAPWQESRAKEAMDANLDKEITIARLACDCVLSTSQFARAFRQSTGCPPHRWLLQRRIKRAQDLLLTSDKTLAEIARACGFSDQSHLPLRC